MTRTGWIPPPWLTRTSLAMTLLVAGAFGFALVSILFGTPEDLEWSLLRAEVPEHYDPVDVDFVAARGPAIMRYEPGTDTTVSVFQCAHSYCRTAIRVHGDLTDEANAGTTLLRASAGTWSIVPLEEPIAVPAEEFDADGRPMNVTEVVEGTFQPASLGPPVALFATSALLVAAGIGLVATTPRNAVITGLAAGLGLGLGFAVAKGATESPPALVLLFLAPATLVCFVALAIAWQMPRGRAVALAAAVLVVAALAASLFLAPYFQHPPMD